MTGMKPKQLGGFEELVLLATAGLGDTGYGVTIQETLEEETGRAVSVGAVYATLDRLERKGLVSSRAGPPTHERGGRRTRLFRVTGRGRQALAESLRVRTSLWESIEGATP